MGSNPGRTMINWKKTTLLRTTKMLAYVIGINEEVNEPLLYLRMQQLFPVVTEQVVGIRVEWEQLQAQVYEQFGTKITAHKIWDRYDKTKRYQEFIEEVLSLVERAYINAVKGLDPNRVFGLKLKRRLEEESNGCCAVCKTPFAISGYQADHKKPWSNGGTTTLDNGQLLCIRCNQEKGTMNAEEYSAHYSRKYGPKKR